MNKILIALLLVVGLSGNAFATDTLHFYCDPEVKEKNYKKKEVIAYGFRIVKGKLSFEKGKTKKLNNAEQLFVTNDAKLIGQDREVTIDPYFISLRNQSGFQVAKIDRTTLKFDKSYMNKECEVVDSWYTLRNKLAKIRKKVEEVRKKELKF